jgi:hypothetical protein
MTLKLRLTGLGSGIDKYRPDYTVYSGQWPVGRIYQARWFWSLIVSGPITRAAQVATWKRPRHSLRKAGMGGRHGRSWKSCRSDRLSRR